MISIGNADTSSDLASRSDRCFPHGRDRAKAHAEVDEHHASGSCTIPGMLVADADRGCAGGCDGFGYDALDLADELNRQAHRTLVEQNRKHDSAGVSGSGKYGIISARRPGEGRDPCAVSSRFGNGAETSRNSNARGCGSRPSPGRRNLLWNGLSIREIQRKWLVGCRGLSHSWRKTTFALYALRAGSSQSESFSYLRIGSGGNAGGCRSLLRGAANARALRRAH
jgi:hypothetical protein